MYEFKFKKSQTMKENALKHAFQNVFTFTGLHKYVQKTVQVLKYFAFSDVLNRQFWICSLLPRDLPNQSTGLGLDPIQALQIDLYQ